jgi:hypothetical protein
MSSASVNPSAYREDALNALTEIRACHDELRTFLADTFDRLDNIVNRLRHPAAVPIVAQEVVENVEPPVDRDMMQDQMDYLTRLVTDLANSVKEREPTTAGKNGAKPQPADM